MVRSESINESRNERKETLERMASRHSSSDAATSGSTTQGVTETVSEMAGQTKQQVDELKSTVTTQAKDQATTKVAAQKDRAAESLGSVAVAFTQVGDQLRYENPQLAQVADTLGHKLQTWSESIGQQDVSDLMHGAERFARQNPTAFLAGAFALGFLGARFLKSSAPEGDGDMGRFGYAGRYDSSYGYGYDTRPSYRPGYGTGGYGAPSDSDTRAGYGTTPSTGYGTATVSGGIASGTADATDPSIVSGAMSDDAGTYGVSGSRGVSRASYSPYAGTDESGTPATER